MIYVGNEQKSKCLCETPTNPWECDEEIFPLLKTLWDKGYDTDFSCSGHPILTFYGETDARPYVKTNVDSGIYISINAPTVRVKDLDKWKYGSAYIKYEDGVDAMIRDISLYIDIPDGWKFNPHDPIIQPYMDMVGKAQADNLMNWINEDTFRAHYVLRCEYHDDEKEPYLNRYMTLLNDRYDMAKLISILPKNE